MKHLRSTFWATMSGGLLLALAGCGGDGGERASQEAGQQEDIDCEASGEPCHPSPEWFAREAENFAKVSEAPSRQATDPEFQARWNTQTVENRVAFQQRELEDPYWDSGENACAAYTTSCTGDPYRYPGVDPFYDEVGEVVPVNFFDAQGARLSGRVWAPRNLASDQAAPAVVIMNGSVQAPETLYWWAAQMLVRNGYVVLTFDPRGQGRSDSQTPDGERGTNFNDSVFRTNLIDAIDFFYSTPDAPYAHNLPGTPGFEAHDGAAPTTAHNPFHDRFDRDRLGAAGHSLGATGVSVVQGEQPWPGTAVADNPIKAIVAWDNLALSTSLDGVDVKPRVPAMGQAGDYFLTPTPYEAPPDAEEKSEGFKLWRDSGVPTAQVQIRGGSHYEWSLLPGFPTSDWIPGEDEGGWGQPLARHYTLAWFDRWLKQSGEPGFEDADARLLADDDWRDCFSFYFLSSRAFPDRDGVWHSCRDMLRRC